MTEKYRNMQRQVSEYHNVYSKVDCCNKHLVERMFALFLSSIFVITANCSFKVN
jgi:hypothetical protein